MNIRYLQSNYLKLSEDNLVKFLYNLILQDVSDVENYQEGYIYNKGDRVYLQENGKHQIFQCLVDESSTIYIDNEWAYILEVYEGNVENVYNVELKEEVHYIEEYNRDSIYTNLTFKSAQSSVAIYCGKKRYAMNHDFTLNGQQVIFNKPFNIGDRLILEVREIIGILPESIFIILYDLNSNPYRVGLNRNGELTIEEYDKTDVNDIKYGELVTGDRTYTMLVDGGSKPYELKAYRKIETYITGTNNEIYKVEATGDTLQLIDCSNDRTAYTDTKYILGLDNKFYTLALKNGNIIATEVTDTGLETRNVDFGVRLINDKFESRVICIDNGKIKLLPYIDNGGYHYINLIDIDTNELYRVSVTDDDTLEINEGFAEDGYSGTRLLKYFYFFDEEMVYNRLFIKQGLLYYEDSPLDVIPDSKGINMLKKDGEMMKLRVPHNGNGLHVVKYISLDNLGTFESPIEGFVVKINHQTKLITVNKEGTAFEIIDTNLPFRTNHHYVLSQDDKVYKLVFENNEIRFVEYGSREMNEDECEIECLNVGAYIKSHEMINRFDIKNGEIILHPISTFRQRIKSADGDIFVVDVIGEPYEEVLTFTNIKNSEFDPELGGGNFYIKAQDGTNYVANINEMGSLDFREENLDCFIDYNITSLVQSSQGLYRIIVEDENIRLEKLFDNIYENDVLSYGNLVKRGLNVQLNDGTWYTFAANGLGEVVINKIDDVDATGLLLKSDDGYNYGLGMLGNDFITYKTFISNPFVQEKLYVKDSSTGKQHALFMKGNRLCSMIVEGNNSSTNYLIMHDAYNNKFKIEITNNVLSVSAL